jgi:hypothetical protein
LARRDADHPEQNGTEAGSSTLSSCRIIGRKAAFSGHVLPRADAAVRRSFLHAGTGEMVEVREVASIPVKSMAIFRSGDRSLRQMIRHWIQYRQPQIRTCRASPVLTRLLVVLLRFSSRSATTVVSAVPALSSGNGRFHPRRIFSFLFFFKHVHF